MRINPSTQLMIIASCSEGCENVESINYEYNVYRKWNFTSNDPQEKWVVLTNNKSFLNGIQLFPS